MSYIVYLALLLGQQPDAPAVAAPPAGEITAEQASSETSESAPAAGSADGAQDEADTAASEDNAGDADAASGGSFMDTLDAVTNSGALGLMRRGGVFMYPILFLGILAAGVMIERYRSLKMLTVDNSAVRDDVLQMLREDRIEEALAYCENETGPVPSILSSGLRKYLILRRLNYDPARIEEQVVKAMDDYGVHVVAALEKHLPVLATVSSVAPMLGFLGTVAGMITSFDEIVASLGETNIVEAAAAGIAVALLTTAFGLVVGIPAFMAFNYFSGVINRFVLEIEESAAHLIEAVTLQLALRQSGRE